MFVAVVMGSTLAAPPGSEPPPAFAVRFVLLFGLQKNLADTDRDLHELTVIAKQSPHLNAECDKLIKKLTALRTELLVEYVRQFVSIGWEMKHLLVLRNSG